MDVLLDRILSLIPKKENGDFVHGAKKEFAQRIGLKSGNVVSDWIGGRSRSYEDYDYKIATVFGVSVEWLRGETDDPTPPASVGRNYFIQPEISEDSVSFPVLGGVAAGYNRLALEDWTGDSIEIPRSYLHGRQPQDYFVLLVKGDSMYPDFRDGDHVLVLHQDTMDRSGQIGVVVYGDENGTLKRVEYAPGEDWMILRPINPQFPPITIRGEELEHCKVLGVAKMVIRELDQ